MTKTDIAASELPVGILTKESFLIVDNAPSFSESFKLMLQQIFTINELSFKDFRYEYVQATSDEAFKKIKEHKNIIVSTTFTTIKSNAIEDLINAGIKHGLKDKNVFSIMQFSTVGSDFEDYKPEVLQLAKNNVHFYFIGKWHTTFDLYK